MSLITFIFHFIPRMCGVYYSMYLYYCTILTSVNIIATIATHTVLHYVLYKLEVSIMLCYGTEHSVPTSNDWQCQYTVSFSVWSSRSWHDKSPSHCSSHDTNTHMDWYCTSTHKKVFELFYCACFHSLWLHLIKMFFLGNSPKLSKNPRVYRVQFESSTNLFYKKNFDWIQNKQH